MPGVKIYVGNLPDRCQESSLRDLFSPYGKITDLIIIKNYAFIHYDSEEDANKAVQDLHKSKLLGKELTVEISKSKQSSGGNKRVEQRRSFPGDNKRPRNAGLMGPNVGGILGMGPNVPPALGLLSAVNAVNTLKNTIAVAAQGQSVMADQPPLSNSFNSSQRGNNQSSIGSRDLSSNDRKKVTDGYVIYERFYVDPSHPLLKGLPVPELPRITDERATDSLVSQDVYVKKDDPYSSDAPIRDDYFAPRRDDPYSSRSNEGYTTRQDEYGTYRERSPLHSRRDTYNDRDGRDSYRSSGGYGVYTDDRR